MKLWRLLNEWLKPHKNISDWKQLALNPNFILFFSLASFNEQIHMRNFNNRKGCSKENENSSNTWYAFVSYYIPQFIQIHIIHIVTSMEFAMPLLCPKTHFLTPYIKMAENETFLLFQMNKLYKFNLPGTNIYHVPRRKKKEWFSLSQTKSGYEMNCWQSESFSMIVISFLPIDMRTWDMNVNMIMRRKRIDLIWFTSSLHFKKSIGARRQRERELGCGKHAVDRKKVGWAFTGWIIVCALYVFALEEKYWLQSYEGVGELTDLFTIELFLFHIFEIFYL